MDQPHNTIGAEATKHRGLMAVVVVLGVLILLAFGILVGGLILGGGTRTDAVRNAPYSVNLGMEPGARLSDATLTGNRLLVRVESANGGVVVILDPATGREIGRVSVQP